MNRIIKKRMLHKTQWHHGKPKPSFGLYDTWKRWFSFWEWQLRSGLKFNDFDAKIGDNTYRWKVLANYPIGMSEYLASGIEWYGWYINKPEDPTSFIIQSDEYFAVFEKGKVYVYGLLNRDYDPVNNLVAAAEYFDDYNTDNYMLRILYEIYKANKDVIEEYVRIGYIKFDNRTADKLEALFGG